MPDGMKTLPAEKSTESPSINNTRLRRFLVLATIKLLKHILPSHGALIFIADKLCIKFGPLRNLPEASTMRFISQHTSIPVPKVYCAFTRKGWTYIVTERIDGEMLGLHWGERSDDSKTKILQQLKKMVAEMRNIPPPRGQTQGICNVDGGPIWDSRLPGTSMCHEPFESVHDFHKHLRGGFDADPNHYDEVSKLIALQDRAWPPPVFTHGDLSSLNILVCGDKITCIIDWETAGWYPSYWEYTAASQVSPMNYFWREEIEKFLDPMPEELEMEAIRQKYFGDF
ncbi:hypothetical protein LSUB1_G006966 [Lachnellula subtilissima]|uniref:Aminoglycoside phosphotransferase domain-containing protein n=1 Tax=Lachnellula subtilissima TaxID=602034 RepID=A0A8H8RF74_9HELO|nr:hypothetical protein LSUB1_G006966 [Lachnellula subtilissima]